MTDAPQATRRPASALFLANRLPWPLADGWARRTFHVVRQLAEQWPVQLLVFAHDDPARLADARAAFGDAVEIRVLPLRPMRRLRGVAGALLRNRPYHVSADSDARMNDAVTKALGGGTVEVLACAGVNMAGYFALDPAHRALHVVDTHNIDSLVVDRFASLIKDPLRRAFATLSGTQMRAWEQHVFSTADLVLVCSDSEVGLARERAPKAAVHCIPNGAELGPVPPASAGADVVDAQTTAAPSLLFFGRLDYFPNVDALHFLKASMLEELRRQLPGFRLRIVGAGNLDAIRTLFADVPEADVVGFVDSLDGELHRADAVIVPLRTGGGTRLKILEAMAAGCPIVSTTIGAEGIDARDGHELLLRDEPQAFAAATAEPRTRPGAPPAPGSRGTRPDRRTLQLDGDRPGPAGTGPAGVARPARNAQPRRGHGGRPAVSLAHRAARFASRRSATFVDALTPRAVRRRQREAALSALAGVQFTSITFVCQGNINRSALADMALRQQLGADGPRIESCGLHPRGNRPSPPESVAAAAALGVPLEAHRSRTTQDVAPTGTLLVGFEPHHLAAWAAGPGREEAAVLLGVFARDSGSRLLIPDPYGHDDVVLRQVFAQVLECVNGLAARLVRTGSSAWSVRQ